MMISVYVLENYILKCINNNINNNISVMSVRAEINDQHGILLWHSLSPSRAGSSHTKCDKCLGPGFFEGPGQTVYFEKICKNIVYFYVGQLYIINK